MSIRASIASLASQTQKEEPPSLLHQPKTDFKTRHRVVRFGEVYQPETQEEENLYNYLHQRADLRVSRGVIPVNFLSYIPLDEGHNLFMETRAGEFDEEDQPIGPQYQISWKHDREVLAAGDGDGWVNSLDDLWTNVLAYFERKNLLSENSLDYLDADPFVLFGIDDQVTQQALRKLGRSPYLSCAGTVPDFDEWAHYLQVDPYDPSMKWLIKAFSETELPKPWTCYKGVGSIVCYIRTDSDPAKTKVTWKHPFYDYFRQLRDFCTEAENSGRQEEVKKVRVNRLLWTYEATRVESDHDQEPLLSPDIIDRLGDIFGYPVKEHGCIVRNLKAQLKVFARTYRERQEVDIADVINCEETLQRDVEKYAEMQDHWTNKVKEEVQFDLDLLSNGELQCVNCGKIALCFCLECKDYLCLACYAALHCKGARVEHAPFRLVPCGLCVNKPAKLHCTFTDRSLCHQCYAMDHIKQLPADGKENQPRRIDYYLQYERFAEFARERNEKNKHLHEVEEPESQLRSEDYEAVLSIDWHSFYDARGVKFYHNFVTGERMRQSPRKVPNTADPGSEPKKPKAITEGENEIGLALEGFDALETHPKARYSAAEQPDLRNLRPPHRKHQPHEVQAL